MTESKAIGLALELVRRHIFHPDEKEVIETGAIQLIADLYKAGYEVINKVSPAIELGEN